MRATPGFLRRVSLLVVGLLLGACAGLPPRAPVTATHASTDVAGTSLARVVVASGAPAHPGLSGFRLLPEAAFAFEARIALVRNAQKTLDVQYYLIGNDDVGLELLRELRNAADRGVRVRLLVDDLYTAGEDELFGTLAAAPNVDVRLFNPLPSRAGSLTARLAFSLHEFSRINHRMHNKLLVADNTMAIAGGRNIANEYFMRSTAANFIDMDVLSVGPIVRRMSEAFDVYWNSEQVRPISSVAPLDVSADAARRRFDDLVSRAAPDVPVRARDVLERTPVGKQIAGGSLQLNWAMAHLLVDDPAKITRTAGEAYSGSVTEGALAVIATARKEVQIASPYFIPGQNGLDMMKRAIENGVSVWVVTNSLGATDEPLAYAGYERYRADMLKIGVRVSEIAPESTGRSGRFGEFGKSISRLHAKLSVVDEKIMFIGSMNLDHRSAAVNTELGLVIDSPELVDDFRRLMHHDHENIGYRLRIGPDGKRVQWLEYDDKGNDVVHEDVPGEFLWLRFKNWLLLPVVGEELL